MGLRLLLAVSLVLVVSCSDHGVTAPEQTPADPVRAPDATSADPLAVALVHTLDGGSGDVVALAALELLIAQPIPAGATRSSAQPSYPEMIR